jgi:glyceraldehyde-3-phosphate dehydrogenase (NAD(P))
MKEKFRVALNGYGVIGRRVADAVQLQKDMELTQTSFCSIGSY